MTVGVRDSKAADGSAPDMAVDTTIAVTITVTNVNEPGTVTMPTSFTGSTSATSTLTDPNGNSHERTVAVGEGGHYERVVRGHQRGDLGQLHAGGRGRGQVPEGHGDLRRR